MTTTPVKSLIDEQIEDIEQKLSIIGFVAVPEELASREFPVVPAKADGADHEGWSHRGEGSVVTMICGNCNQAGIRWMGPFSLL
ncbi:MAG: hypothetical protein ACRER3_11480, partial [Pseudomonas fluorescens]